MAGSPGINRRAAAPSSAAREDAPLYEHIELLFFAYRDFVGDADRLLEDYGFGRAHHRVLHFVSRHPGLTIAELLDILAITKQSLNRVLQGLILAKNFITTRAPAQSTAGTRQLFTTEIGRKTWRANSPALQTRRFCTPRSTGSGAPRKARNRGQFLLAMIDAPEREKVMALIASGRGRAK